MVYVPSFQELIEKCSFSTIDDVVFMFPGIDYDFISESNKFNSNTYLYNEVKNPVVDGVVLGRANPLSVVDYDLLGLSLVELESEKKFVVPFYASYSKKKVFLDENFGFKTCASSILDLDGLERIVSCEGFDVDSLSICRKNFPSQVGLFSACLFSSFVLSPYVGVGIYSLGLACSGVIGLGDAVNDFNQNRNSYYKKVFEQVKASSLKTYY